jgi:prevent-host-death family protein
MAIRYSEDIKPISYIKTNAASMMRYVNESKKSIIITQNGEAKAALVDIDEYQSMQDAFNLLRIIKLSEDDLANGKHKDAEQVFSDIRKKLKRNA